MKPTKLRKMRLNSVDFVRRGANPVADIALFKSYESENDSTEIAKSDIAKSDLNMYYDALEESFSSIMKDDTLDNDGKFDMVVKSLSEFYDTMGDYLSSLSILEKSFYEEGFETAKSSILGKGENEHMGKFEFENVDKSLLTPEEAFMLDALIAKATSTEEDNDDTVKAGKVNPAAAQEEEEDNLAPEVKKALEEVETLKKSYEMQQLTEIAKKYEMPLGKKAEEVAKTLYDLKKSGESNYNAYVAALDAQVELVEKSGIFSEIGKSGFGHHSPIAKSEAETKLDTIAKSFMSADPNLNYTDAVTKACEQHPELMAEYEASAGF